MSFVLGAGGPLSALALMGKSYPAWQLVLWAIGLGLLGILIAAMLRNKLIVVEELPFPTGAATAEVIETIHTTRAIGAAPRAPAHAVAALAAMYVTWFRDGPSALIPQMTAASFAIGGLGAASLSLGISWSPLLASTGVLMGLRGAASMLLGAVVDLGGARRPWLVHSGLVATADYSAFVTWLVWPALGLMMSSTFLPLLLDWRVDAALGPRSARRSSGSRTPARRARAPAGPVSDGVLLAVCIVGAGRPGPWSPSAFTRW